MTLAKPRLTTSQLATHPTGGGRLGVGCSDNCTSEIAAKPNCSNSESNPTLTIRVGVYNTGLNKS